MTKEPTPTNIEHSSHEPLHSHLQDLIHAHGHNETQAFLRSALAQEITADTWMESFTKNYLGSWANRQELVANQVESLGWQEHIDELIASQGVPPGCLRWDTDSMMNMIETVYEVVQYEGRCYLFHR